MSLPIWAFGLVGACIGAVRVMLSLNVYRFKSLSYLGVVAPALAGVFLIIAGSQASLYMLLFIGGFYAVMAPAELLASASFQKSMSGESRATTTSAMAVIVELFSIVFLVLVGVVIDALGVLSAYQVGGAYFLLFAVWAFWQERRGYGVTSQP